jgi:hypothetical protein
MIKTQGIITVIRSLLIRMSPRLERYLFIPQALLLFYFCLFFFVNPFRLKLYTKNTGNVKPYFIASGGQGTLFEKTAPWTPTKTFY